MGVEIRIDGRIEACIGCVARRPCSIPLWDGLGGGSAPLPKIFKFLMSKRCILQIVKR